MLDPAKSVFICSVFPYVYDPLFEEVYNPWFEEVYNLLFDDVYFPSYNEDSYEFDNPIIEDFYDSDSCNYYDLEAIDFTYFTQIESIAVGAVVEVPYGRQMEKVQAVVQRIEKYSPEEYGENKDLCNHREIIRVVPESEQLEIRDDYIISRDGKTLAMFIGNKKEEIDFLSPRAFSARNRKTDRKWPNILIPQGVEVIYPNAFRDCGIEKITFPDGLKVIGSKSFEKTKIKNVKIPASVDFIGCRAFPSSKAALGRNHPNFYSDGTCIFKRHEDGTQDLLWCFKLGISEYTVPEGTKKICSYAFTDLRNSIDLTLNDDLQSIEKNALDCTEIKTLPYSVLEIGAQRGREFKIQSDHPYFFIDNEALYRRLENGGYRLISAPEHKKVFKVLDGTVEIAEYAFFEKFITRLELPDSISVIEDYAFLSCFCLKKITIPKSVKRINMCTFYACESLEEVHIPESLLEIRKYAFRNCRSLKKINIPEALKRIECAAFSGCGKLKITSKEESKRDILELPSTLKRIPAYCFSETAFSSVVIPESVEVIEANAFTGCINLRTVILPESIKEIGEGAFFYCSNLTSVSTGAFVGKNRFQLPSALKRISPYCFAHTAFSTVTVPESIESIEENAFSECKNLRMVILHKDVKKIGEAAFSDCGKLDTVSAGADVKKDVFQLPPLIKRIPKDCFYSAGFSSLVIPEGITAIESGAFSQCHKLCRVTLPASLREIALFHLNCQNYSENIECDSTMAPTILSSDCIGSFSECKKLMAVEVNNDNPVFEFMDGCLYSKGMKELLVIPGGWKEEEFHVPEQVRDITTAFALGKRISKVFLPEGIERVRKDAFWTSSITEFHIPSSVCSFEDEWFLNCPKDRLVCSPKGSFMRQFCEKYSIRNYDDVPISKEEKQFLKNFIFEAKNGTIVITGYQGKGKKVSIPESVMGCPVVEITPLAFEKQDIVEVWLPDSIRKIGKEAFCGCSFMRKLRFPAGIQIIEDRVCSGCSKLNDVAIPEGVVEIKEYAFYGCQSLESVVLPGTLEKLGSCVFDGCKKLLEIRFSEGMRILSSGYFYIESLSQLVFPSTLENIELKLFEKKSNLSPLHLCVCKGSYAESYCQEYTERNGFYLSYTPLHLSLLKKSSLYEYKIENEGIVICGIQCPRDKVVDIPDELAGYPVKAIELKNCAFAKRIDEFYLPASVSSFSLLNNKVSILQFVVSEKNPYLKSEGSALYSKDGKILYCVGDKSLTYYHVPEGTKSISLCAFLGMKSLNSVSFPESLQRIESRAFCHCEDLEVLGGEGVIEIGFAAFDETAVKKQQLGRVLLRGDKNIGDKNIKEFVVPEGITQIGPRAFADFQCLESVELPSTLQKIGAEAFSKCSSLQYITIPESVSEIGESAFEFCVSLKEVHLPALKRISKGIFSECTSLEHIEIPDPVLEIEESAFKHCESLKDVIISSVQKIGDQAFSNCNSLQSIKIPESVSEIGESSFANCEILKEVTIPGVQKIRRHTFSGCCSLQRVQISESVSEIERYAFSYCLSLKEVNIPAAVKTLNADVFYHCDSLQFVNLQEGLIEIDEGAFFYCQQLGNLTLPSTLTTWRLDDSFYYYYYGTKCDLETFTVHPDNPALTAVDGVLFTKDKKTLIRVPRKYSQKRYSVPEGVVKIERLAMNSVDGIEELYFPDSVMEFGVGACSKMKSLKRVRLPKKLSQLSAHAFRECGQLAFVEWPDSLEEIGNSCFSGCSVLEPGLPETIRTIDYHAFENTGWKKVTIPKSVQTARSSAFYGAEEIEVFDSFEPDSNQCCFYISNLTNTEHWVTVRSAVTGEIKYKVWIPRYGTTREVESSIESLWGNNASFSFDEYDLVFPKMNNTFEKAKLAVSRLTYPVMLTDSARKMYLRYLKQVGPKMMPQLISDGDLERICELLPYGVITKSNINKFIDLSAQNSQTEITAFLLNYKNENL